MNCQWHQGRILRGACISFLIAGLCAGLIGEPGRAYAEEAVLRVVVPRQTIYPGQSIRPEMLSSRIWRGRGGLEGIARHPRDLIGKVSRSTLLPNRIIFTAALRKPHTVVKGQIVRLFFKLDGIEIHSKGIARQAGAVGAFVRVQNLDSGRLISGMVQSNGSIQVGGHQ